MRWAAEAVIGIHGEDFDEVAAHHPVRERFEELASAHQAIDVLEGDRQWLSMRVRLPNADDLVRELWELAGAGR
jgi:hypothetical protein